MQTNTVRARFSLSALGLVLTAAACSPVVDGVLRGRDAGFDGGADACRGAVDGTSCGEGQVCVAEVCETREWCDEDSDCDDRNACNGAETCGEDHECAAGAPLADGAECATRDDRLGVCWEEECVPTVCGDGRLDPSEQCDDGNTTSGDGCDSDCTFSCTSDDDCDDGSVCTGEETCDVDRHTCVPGTPLVCNDGNACTTDSCDDVLGCVYTLIDEDGDGFAASARGACGTDCDDTRADVYPGAPEICDLRDNDCNGVVDDGVPVWYPDCDHDGYAELGATGIAQCEPPVNGPTGCAAGGWTSRNPDPSLNAVDCAPEDPAVHPGAEEIPGDEKDQNCDGIELCWLDADNDGFRPIGSTATRTSTDLDCRDPYEAPTSAPATDCCDTDANAFPRQSAYFGVPRNGCGGYDYDCNGRETPWDTSVLSSCVCSFPDCSIGAICQDGWLGTHVPECGAPASRVQCQFGRFPACNSYVYTQQQRCR